MVKKIASSIIVAATVTLGHSFARQAGRPSETMPHLERRGKVTQFVVDGHPFLILGGELHNSSSSSLAYLRGSLKRFMRRRGGVPSNGSWRCRSVLPWFAVSARNRP